MEGLRIFSLGPRRGKWTIAGQAALHSGPWSTLSLSLGHPVGREWTCQLSGLLSFDHLCGQDRLRSSPQPQAAFKKCLFGAPWRQSPEVDSGPTGKKELVSHGDIQTWPGLWEVGGRGGQGALAERGDSPLTQEFPPLPSGSHSLGVRPSTCLRSPGVGRETQAHTWVFSNLRPNTRSVLTHGAEISHTCPGATQLTVTLVNRFRISTFPPSCLGLCM